MITTPDGVEIYSAEDMQQQFKVGVDYATNAINNDIRHKIIEHFRYSADCSMTRDDALAVMNELLEYLGYEKSDLTKTYAVEVQFDGYTIGEFNDIEALSADEAIGKVSVDMEVEASMEINVSYNGETVWETVSIEGYRLEEDFTFHAQETDN